MLRRAVALLMGTPVLLLVASALASAQGATLSRAGSGARAAGMADAFIAVSDDGTAVSWNPAGLAQLRQPELSLVYALNDRGLRLTGLRSPDDRLSYSALTFETVASAIDFASAALPFSIARRPVTVQLGWHRLYQLGQEQVGETDRRRTDEPDVTEARIALDDHLLGDIDVVSVAGAVKLTSHLAIGASLDSWRGAWRQRLSRIETPGPSGPPAFEASRSEFRLRGHTVSTGLLLTYQSWNAGLVHHAAFWSSFRAYAEGYSTEAPRTGPPPPDEAPADVPRSSAKARDARFHIPRAVGIGIARRLPGRWMVAASVNHDQWSDALLDGIPDQPGRINFFDGAPPELSTTRDTLAVSVGAERLFVREGVVVPVRVGFGWEPQGEVDSGTRDAADYRVLSVGLGYNTNRLKVDAAVQYRWTSFLSSQSLSVATAFDDGLGIDAVGRARSDEWRVKVSAIYRIADTEKLRGLLRRIFG